MACLPLMKSIATISPVKFGCICSGFGSRISSRSSARLHISATLLGYRRFRLYCKSEDSGNRSDVSGEEPPESLFMKELRRRGITPTSLLEENKTRNDRAEEANFKEEDGGWNYSVRNGTTSDTKTNLSNQLKMSRLLNSEGLEGLIPRAKLLLRLGATFFLGFWPLVLITFASFSAMYLYFGAEFIHDGSNSINTPLHYVNPYDLLGDNKIYPAATPLPN